MAIPANGVSFASQDECVANGAHGGTYGPAARVFAIAFTNLDGVAGFNRGADVLISELVDTNRDNTVNAGDTVHMGSYPLTFAGTTFGTFGVTSHTVTEPPDVAPNGVQVTGAGSQFFAMGHGTFFEFYEESTNGLDDSFLVDSYAAGCDFVKSSPPVPACLQSPSPSPRCAVPLWTTASST